MARQEAKHARICSTKRRQVDHKSSKNLLRHVKAPQVLEPTLWRDMKPGMPESHKKASRPPKVIKSLKSMERPYKSQSLLDGETGSQVRQNLLDHVKASR